MAHITADLLAWNKEGLEEQGEGENCLRSAIRSAN